MDVGSKTSAIKTMLVHIFDLSSHLFKAKGHQRKLLLLVEDYLAWLLQDI
jgi:hypothetical protein